ncbi:hypothetical protein ERY430_40142 [Erythrobacter sp. EC-HK427]|nr:hypothetical protein ERY430_40142 [Erythrobacter sp. EC-HK427]
MLCHCWQGTCGNYCSPSGFFWLTWFYERFSRATDAAEAIARSQRPVGAGCTGIERIDQDRDGPRSLPPILRHEPRALSVS